MLGCSTVDATVSEEPLSLRLVGVTDDSVGLDTVESVLGSGGSCNDSGGDGPGNETEEMSSTLGVSIVDGDGTLILRDGGVRSTSESKLVVGTDGVYVDGGNGMSLGSISTYDNSLSSVSSGMDGTPDGLLLLRTSGSITGVGSRSSIDTSLSTGSGVGTELGMGVGVGDGVTIGTGSAGFGQ